jgi:hypothetical protein
MWQTHSNFHDHDRNNFKKKKKMEMKTNQQENLTGRAEQYACDTYNGFFLSSLASVISTFECTPMASLQRSWSNAASSNLSKQESICVRLSLEGIR